MKIKAQYAIVLFCSIFIFLPITNAHSASTWYSVDDADDVEFYVDNIPQSTGDYHNEIDVDRVELVEDHLVLYLHDQPINDQDHFYELYVYWFDYPFKVIELNYTKAEFGEGINHVYTQLYLGLSEITEDVYDDIYIDGKAIWCPVPLFIHIENITAEQIEGGAYYYVDKADGDYYFDQIRLGTITMGSPGYIFAITMISIVFVVAIYLVRKKS